MGHKAITNIIGICLSILVVFATAFATKSESSVQAWYCAGQCGTWTCLDTGASGLSSCPRSCNKCQHQGGSCNVNLQRGEFRCNKGDAAGCGCNATDCWDAGGYICTNNEAVCDCSCEPVSCPPGNPPNKFMTRQISNGNGISCNGGGCDGEPYACDPKHVNSAPLCSIAPTSIVMNRQDTPRQFNFTATDNDWGDSVEITGVKIVGAGNSLNNCAQIYGTSGQSLLGYPVRPGRPDSQSTNISQTSTFLIDARDSHGVYTKDSTGRSVCMGELIIEIHDVDSDGNGPDVSERAECRVNVTIINQAPTISDIRIEDRDTMTSQRSSGNLLNGTAGTVTIGSTYTSATRFRAHVCKSELSDLMPITCPINEREYVSGIKNPLFLEFTVSDRNGANDIMQAGVWLQLREPGKNSNVANYPLVAAQRLSFQALYSEKETLRVGANNHFTSRGCLTEACGPLNMATSSKTVFTGLGMITRLGAYAGVGSKKGNLYNGSQKSATTNQWHTMGYPDCLARGGCTGAHVPEVARTAATSVADQPENYAWAIGADESSLLCYPSNNQAPRVVAASSSVVCPSNCAACIKREGLTQKDANSITYRFGIYFNDTESGQGMPPGLYSLFVSALDKVGAPLYQMTGKGPEGWTLFDRTGNVCQGASCPAGSGFALRYDPIPPTITVNKLVSEVDGIFSATVNVSDVGGSGIKGVTNRFMAMQGEIDGEPSGTWEWAMKLNSKELFDGRNDHLVLTNAPESHTITLRGGGFSSGQRALAGLCAYDVAGNMGCNTNPLNYIFLANWLKTSFGSVYSGSTTGSQPFSGISLPSNQLFSGTRTQDETRKSHPSYSPYVTIYSPFNEQEFTLATGLLLTSSTNSDFGVSGGRETGATQTPLGFAGQYRTVDASNAFNITGLGTIFSQNEYDRLLSIATNNCQALNVKNPGSCVESDSFGVLGEAAYSVLKIDSHTVTNDISCKNVNIIFVAGKFNISGDLVKEDKRSGCLFVLKSGGELIVEDSPSQKRIEVSGQKGGPTIDRFAAGIVATNGATVSFRKPNLTQQQMNSASSFDRLEIEGWVHTIGQPPHFLRNLAPVDNRRFPSEWIIYDATLLDVLRPLVGVGKSSDLVCGTSHHILCARE